MQEPESAETRPMTDGAAANSRERVRKLVTDGCQRLAT
jgi:hypothetical protein